MAMRPILILPDPRLRKVAEPVGTIDAALRALAEDMLETMYEAPGIGLAAPQIGVMKRLFVMDCAGKDEAPAPMVFVDPELVRASEEELVSEEGCLSIPEVYEDVSRPARVRLRWTDLDGKTPRGRFRGSPLGLRPARTRPSERQAVHRPSQSGQAHHDHQPHEEAQAGEGTRLIPCA